MGTNSTGTLGAWDKTNLLLRTKPVLEAPHCVLLYFEAGLGSPPVFPTLEFRVAEISARPFGSGVMQRPKSWLWAGAQAWSADSLDLSLGCAAYQLSDGREFIQPT